MIGSILLSRWSYSLLGVLLLAAVVWWLGPLLPALEDWPPRLATLVLLLGVWLAANLLISLRDNARDNALTDGVGGGDAAGEKAAIEAKIGTALTLLKRARGRRGFLYEQPWYAIIGPPGAGKTTALLNAGLEFPLAEQMGRGALSGVGGTRQLEWWFTEQAVLIDTAGRYTTQDSDAAVDRAGWDAFLDLLKRTRPRQPLNGVIIAIALSDIAQGTPAERSAHARAIRARVVELETKFGLRLPVYALFTKVDLLAGFMEFFEDLDRDGRAQVWGSTFPLAMPAADTLDRFTAAFDTLLERLGRRLLDRLQAEPNPERRAAIAGFPTQVASLRAAITQFVGEAFGAQALTPAPMLRGVYLNSATQEGTPIDRLTGSIARAFGLSPQRVERLRPQAGRTYFLTRLLRDVVFNEAMLVSGGAAPKRRRKFVTLGFAAVAGLIVLGAAGGLWRAYRVGQQAVTSAADALAQYDKASAGLPLDPVNDADLARIVPLLDQARAAQQSQAAAPAGWAVLAQDAKMNAGRRAIYRHALERVLFPRLIWRLEAQLRGNLTNPEFAYEATRIYLMLTGQGPVDRDLLREWTSLDWQVADPGPGAAAMRAALARHLDALLEEPLPPIVPDGDLVAAARATFADVPLAQRIYSRIGPSVAAQSLPPWQPSTALGAAGAVVFVRASGRPFTEGVPGFYTPAGFHKVLLPSLDRATRQVAAEGWVLGQKVNIDPSGAGIQALEQQVIALYLADYIKIWDAVLADIAITPMRSLPQAAQNLFILASTQSPMRALLVAAAQQLRLTTQADAPPTTATNDSAARLQAALGAQPIGTVAASPGHEVDAHFKPLLDLVGTSVGAPLDRVMPELTDLQQQLAKLAAAGLRAGPAPSIGANDPALVLRTEALRQPQPLARWLTAMAASGMALRGGDPRQQVVAAYNIASGPAALCAAAVSGRYPFTANATQDSRLEDFALTFAPGGALDGFFNTLLRPFVDIKSNPWKLQPVDGVAPPIEAGELAQFQRAAQIRDLFFADGRTIPTFRFDVTPSNLDAKSRMVTLDFDGTAVARETAVKTPSRATEISWPGGKGMQSVGLRFDPAPTNAANGWQEHGTWALFRLLGHAKQVSAAGEKIAVTFQAGRSQAAFDLHTGPRNPFAPGLLAAFRCPLVQ